MKSSVRTFYIPIFTGFMELLVHFENAWAKVEVTITFFCEQEITITILAII